MKKKILLGILALSVNIFAQATTQVDVSANLIKAVEISTQSSTTQFTITKTQKGAFSFPDTILDITGEPRKAVVLKVPQTLKLEKSGDTSKMTMTTVTFGEGVITTDGTNATTTQILSASGSIQNTLKISGNLETTLEAGSYGGTVKIEANYN